MRKLVILSLVSSLLLNSTAYAGPKEDAYAYVAKTEDAARAHAQNLLMTYVRDNASILQMQASKNDALVSIVGEMNQSNSKVNILLEKFLSTKTSADEQMSFLSTEDLDQLYDELNTLYINTRAAETVRDQEILRNFGKVASLRHDLEYVRTSVLKVCKEGVASNLDFSELPAVRPVPPAFSIYLSGEMNSSGDVSTNAPRFTMDGENLEWVAPVAVTAAALGAGTHAYFTTNLGMQAFSGTAALSSTSMMVGAGVGIGVALIAYGIAMTEAINQSKEVSGALWIVFDKKANAETVRAEFQKLCEPLVAKLEGIPARIMALNDSNADAVKLYGEQKIKVDKVMAELEKLSKAIQQKEQELTLVAEGATEADKKKWVEEKMLDSDEKKAYLNYMKDVDQSVFFEMLEITLIELSRSYKKVQDDIYKHFDDLFKTQMKKYNKDLNAIIQTIRKLRFKPTTLAAIKEEAKLYEDLAGAYREFDVAFAKYIDDLFMLGQTIDSRERLQNWLKLAEELSQKYPTSMSAKVLKAQAQQVIRILEL